MKRATWSDLAVVAAIAEAGSFKRAGVALGTSSSAVSHALRGLETRLGVRLFNRSTRSIAPTEAGEDLLAALRPAAETLQSALARVEQRAGRVAGRLRISAHRTAAVYLIQPRLAAFAARHPEVQVELDVQDGLVDIVGAGFDAGVRLADVLDRDMISVRISEPESPLIVATPGYLDAAGRPRTPADLLAHRCLAYRMTSSGALYRWAFSRGDESVLLDPPAVFISNDVQLLRDAALAGMGVTSLSRVQVAEALATGALESVLEDWTVPIPANYLYYPSRRQMTPALRAFVDALKSPV